MTRFATYPFRGVSPFQRLKPLNGHHESADVSEDSNFHREVLPGSVSQKIGVLYPHNVVGVEEAAEELGVVGGPSYTKPSVG